MGNQIIQVLVFIIIPILCVFGIVCLIKSMGKFKKRYFVHCSKHGLCDSSEDRKACEYLIEEYLKYSDEKCKFSIRGKYVLDHD